MVDVKRQPASGISAISGDGATPSDAPDQQLRFGASRPVHANVDAAFVPLVTFVPPEHWLREIGAVGGGFYRTHGKRVLDIVVALAAIPAVLPVMVLISLLLLASGQPVFTGEFRLGRHQTLFRLRSFGGGLGTPLGRLIRSGRLERLPQLWNVIVGDMSLVGPRPMRPAQLAQYGNANAYFELRPGLTGDWSYPRPRRTGLGHRSAADARYLKTMTLAGDLAVLGREITARPTTRGK